MLREWLDGRSPSSFLRTHLQRHPHAGLGTAQATARRLDWDAFGRVLATAAERIVVAQGTIGELEPPRDLAALQRVMGGGCGVIVRNAERHDPAFAALANAFGVDVPGEVGIHLHAMPAGTHGLGWHWDVEDVFVVQSSGIKAYFLRHNTLDPTALRGSVPDFALHERERSPVHEARLCAGDWLYVPARWWRVALCEKDALTISIGVLPHQPHIRPQDMVATSTHSIVH